MRSRTQGVKYLQKQGDQPEYRLGTQDDIILYICGRKLQTLGTIKSGVVL
jgi:hypothetical protein